MVDTVDNMKIALALSGGGVRASVFHLGILQRLAEDNLLENISLISTVSGGTLVTGLVYSILNRWPSSEEFKNQVLTKVKYYLTKTDIQRYGFLKLFSNPWLLSKFKANIISQAIEHCWNINQSISEIPDYPEWVINATTYETGKNWRFTHKKMGDYLINYVNHPKIKLSTAMAASASFPGLIGPLVLKTKKYTWFKYKKGHPIGIEKYTPTFSKLHLWDGGVYDNLGVEAVFKPNSINFKEEYNFLIVSDVSKALGIEERLAFKSPFRLVLITMDQVRSLRARQIVSYLSSKNNSGVYLRSGNTARHIMIEAGMSTEQIKNSTKNVLTKQEVEEASNFPTTLRSLTNDEFDLIFKHGWEVANYTLFSRCPTLFNNNK
ncbi:hypothetical protein CPJCM30710_12620 [Clostridium polyendosporum]|uniref:PNPLA domain-containing protein n=1 Tax=Clostridium polyendosporum TaxID=69208 RepID=A0A919RYB2_9CLOT|nr:patatin-like phospholipase family protein [Clostridium polyendosporum]GIM28596.1 hypothetical protein CPJCM30710_12620 [Clostridium polyendosporum]